METNQGGIMTAVRNPYALTPEMCRAVFAELEAVHSELSLDEGDVFGCHATCNGFSLVAAQMVRAAMENGLQQAEFVEWASRWADKAEDATDPFEARRAIAEIRGYVASVTRFDDASDAEGDTERMKLERRVCDLAHEADSMAVSAWALVFEAANHMIMCVDRGEPERVATLAARIVVRLMYEVCSNDEDRNAMVADLQAFIERARAQQTSVITSAAGWRLGGTAVPENQNGPTARDLLLAAKSLDASCNGSELGLSRSERVRVERIAHELFERAAAAQAGPGGELTPAEQLELACECAMIRWPEQPLSATRGPSEAAAGIAGAQGVDACAAARNGDWAGAMQHLEHCVALEREHGGPGAWAPVLKLAHELAGQALAAAGAR